MARSISLSPGFTDTYAPPRRVLPARTMLSRVMNWLMRSQQRHVDDQITRYLEDSGVDRLSDSVERDIEYRFLARQHERW